MSAEPIFQHQIEATRERVGTILERIADGFVALDRDWRFTYVNHAAEFLLQRDRGELLGRTLQEAFPDDSPETRAALERALRSSDITEFEEFHPSLGSWLEYRVFPAEEGLSVHIRDITDRRVVQEERERLLAGIEAERARLTAVMEQMPVGVILADAPSGKMVAVNRRAVEILGDAPISGVVEEYSRDYVGYHPDGRPYVPEEWPIARAVQRGETVVEEEIRVRAPAGERIVLASATPVRDSAGGTVAGVLTFSDVTEQRRREETDHFLMRVSDLLASSLNPRVTLQSVADMCAGGLADYCIVHVEEHGRILAPGIAHADPARKEIVRGLLRRFPVEPDSPHPVIRTLRTGESQLIRGIEDDLLERMSASPEHLEMLRDLGLASAIVVPLQARGRTLGAISLGRTGGAPPYGPEDVAVAEELARRAALAVDNARLYEEARQAARARDEVLAVVSHDLRNPLHAVLLAATVLEDFSSPEQWTERDRKQLQVIRRSAEQMTRLIQDLVEVIALESKATTLHRARVEAEPLLAGVVELFHPLAEEHGIRLSTEIAAGTPALEADRGRILQVFSNLVGNALKFTAEGGAVKIRAEPAEGKVRFSVSDTGVGIAPEHLPHLFDRFWQAKRGDRRGLGLGLAICEGIVLAHGGRIWVESEVGRGTTVAFTLPALPF